MKKLQIALIAVVLSVFAANVMASDNPTKEDAKGMVDKAVAYAKANGRDATIAEIAKKDGKFTNGPALYAIAFDKNGNILAHPYNPALVGKDMTKAQDPDGKFFATEMAKTAANGGGWVDYKFTNPGTKKVEAKTTYVQSAGDFNVGCGIYVGK